MWVETSAERRKTGDKRGQTDKYEMVVTACVPAPRLPAYKMNSVVFSLSVVRYVVGQMCWKMLAVGRDDSRSPTPREKLWKIFFFLFSWGMY